MLSGLKVLYAFAEKPVKATINWVYLQEISNKKLMFEELEV